MTLKTNKTEQVGPDAMAIAGEAIHLLRGAPAGAIVVYLVGTVPFVLVFLYFWSDMARGAYASDRCFITSLCLAAVFVWMKVWQAVFADSLMAALVNRPARRWTVSRAARLIVIQLVVQSYGLILIPLSLVAVAPFYCVYAFYQNITTLGNGADLNLRSLCRAAQRQALLWPKQNHVLIWLFNPWILALGMALVFGSLGLAVSMMPALHGLAGLLWMQLSLLVAFYSLLPLAPFGCVVAGNVALLITVLPNLLSSLLGIDTVFSLSGLHGIFNTTFLACVYGISYVCLDPLMKAAYVLRCFYGESLHTGSDLRVELQECALCDAS